MYEEVEPLTPLEREARLWGLVLHLSQFASYAIPVAGIAAPIIIWQIQKERMPLIEEHGKNVVNWFLSVLIYAGISFLLLFVLVGFLLFIVLGVLIVVFPIIGAIKAYNGEVWKYPLAINFL